MDKLIQEILIDNRRNRADPVEINGLDAENCKFDGIYIVSHKDYNAMPMYVHKEKSNLVLFSYYERFVRHEPYTFWRLTDSITTDPDSKAGIYFNVKISRHLRYCALSRGCSA